jgi:hypothetical protein
MTLAGQYDSELQMFCEPTREPDVAVLRFLRWLAEEGRWEHAVAGHPIGAWAEPGQERCRQ